MLVSTSYIILKYDHETDGYKHVDNVEALFINESIGIGICVFDNAMWGIVNQVDENAWLYDASFPISVSHISKFEDLLDEIVEYCKENFPHMCE